MCLVFLFPNITIPLKEAFFMKIVLTILLVILGLFACYVLFIYINSLLIDTEKEYTKYSNYHHGLFASGVFLAVYGARVRLHVSGMEKVPKEGRFLIVGNHRSKYDPILTWWVFRKYHLSCISKEKNFHIPFYGPIMRRILFLSIDRSNPRASMKTILQATKQLTDDQCNVLVYPEGTRSMDDYQLLPFHDGVFKIAKKADVPIVVVTTMGTEHIAKNYPLHSTPVRLDVVEVIPKETVRDCSTHVLSAQVREIMMQHLDDYPAPDTFPPETQEETKHKEAGQEDAAC